MSAYAPVVVGTTPPVDTSCLWLSTSHKDMQVSQDRGDRITIIKPTLSWEGNVCQEPSVWYRNGLWQCFYTAGNAASAVIGYASAPTPEGPWTKYPTPLLGHGNGNITSYTLDAFHANVYIEGSTGYFYWPDVATKGRYLMATFDPANPTAGFTYVGPVFTVPTSATPANTQGNSSVIKDPDGVTYWFMYEGAFNNYQHGLAKGTSPAGPFTNVADPIVSLRPGFQSSNFVSMAVQNGGPWLMRDPDGTWVLYYHSGPNGRPTAGYRAFSTDLLNWTIDRNGHPIVRRMVPAEVDQVADLSVVDNPGVGAAIFWSQMQNTPTFTGSIGYAPLRPVLKVWDGNHWVRALDTPDTALPKFLDPVNSLTGDFTTTTVGSDVTIANGTVGGTNSLTLTYTPTENVKARIRCRAKVSTSAAGTLTLKLDITPTTFLGGSPYIPAIPASAEYDDMPASSTTFRTLDVWMTVYLVAGVSYTVKALINNGTGAATTTVKSGSQFSFIEMDTTPN